VSWRGCSQALPSCFSCMLYYCFTTALLLLYYCFTSALLLRLQVSWRACSQALPSRSGREVGSRLYYCFTTALLLLYYCFTTALLLQALPSRSGREVGSVCPLNGPHTTMCPLTTRCPHTTIYLLLQALPSYLLLQALRSGREVGWFVVPLERPSYCYVAYYYPMGHIVV
jgi:hypothetical protein